MKATRLNILLTLFLFSLKTLFAENIDFPDLIIEPVQPEQISDLIEENDLLIGGLVNPLSGNLCMRKYDLIAKGTQDIVLSRTFIAPNMPKEFDPDRAFDQYYLYKYSKSMKGWVFFPHRMLQLYIIDEKPIILLTLPNGISLNYTVQSYEKGSQTFLFDKNAIGISNFSQEPSGMNDLRNVYIYGTNNWNKIIVHTPDGKCYHYKAPFTNKHSTNYFLEKEILPNGKILRYSLIKSQNSVNKRPILRIESCDPQEKYVYATLDVQQNLF